jgi:hypothetical protein
MFWGGSNGLFTRPKLPSDDLVCLPRSGRRRIDCQILLDEGHTACAIISPEIVSLSTLRPYDVPSILG